MHLFSIIRIYWLQCRL